MVLAMECAVYQGSVSSGSPGSYKITAKVPQLRVGGHNYFLFAFYCLGPLHIGDPLSHMCISSILYRPECLYYIFYFPSFLLLIYSSYNSLCVRDPKGNLYAQNNVASCNGCSHQRTLKIIAGSLGFH